MNRTRKIFVGLGAAGALAVGATVAVPALADDAGPAGDGLTGRYGEMMERDGIGGWMMGGDHDRIHDRQHDRTHDRVHDGSRDWRHDQDCDGSQLRDRDGAGAGSQSEDNDATG